MATESTMYTLDQFFSDTRTTIRKKGIPSGLAEIREQSGEGEGGDHER